MHCVAPAPTPVHGHIRGPLDVWKSTPDRLWCMPRGLAPGAAALYDATFLPHLCQVCSESRKVLSGAGLQLQDVADIASPEVSAVSAWNQSGYTKLNLWRLTDYSKLVYVDADCLVLQRFACLTPRVPPAVERTHPSHLRGVVSLLVSALTTQHG